MAQQTTDPAQAIPLNDLHSTTGPDSTSPSNSQIFTFQDLNGSSTYINGVNAFPTGNHYHGLPRFCHRWRPPGNNATKDGSTVE